MQTILILAATVLSLNGTWDFKLLPKETSAADGVTWSKIEVPSNWEMKGFGTPRYGTDIEGKCISGEVGVYRRTFEVPRDWTDRVFLRFDGVMFGAAVMLNGKPAADFLSSYNRYEFDVTDLVRRDAPNELVVRTHGFPKGGEFDTHDDWVLHGIFREVALVGRPNLHLKDWQLTTRLAGSSAEVALRAELSGQGTVAWRLIAANGQPVATAEGLTAKVSVANAVLWSAETPTLYRLELTVKDEKGAETERFTERVGLREVTWDGRVFKVNGRPVKLRGVDHHDLSPLNGRAITAAEQRRDVELMKAANCNFIRTSHYPPSVALLDVCDELGVYLMDEVPFGYGDKHLTDASYGPLLCERAELTVKRDKNRPSVVIWSVGNENPVSDIMRAAARRVHELDPSRPWCFPMQPTTLKKHLKTHLPSDLGDLVNWHYPRTCGTFDKVRLDLDTFDRPYVFGEYAHAYGTDFGYFEDHWTELWDDPAFAGGGVWMFQDQGILRPAADVPAQRLKSSTWPDAAHAYDTYATYGTDGVVYSDRTPQTCYYEVRKVYAPVVCGRAHLPFPAGGGTNWWIAVENRYDHLSLREAVEGTWRLRADRAIVAEGRLNIPSLAPHAKGFLCLDGLPRSFGPASVVWLEVAFTSRRDGHQVAEKSYVLSERFETARKGFKTRVAYDRERDRVTLRDAAGKVVLESPLVARMDRRSMIGKDLRLGLIPPLLPTSVKVIRETAAALDLDVAWSNLSGRVTFAPASGMVRVDYTLEATADWTSVEAGLAFVLPAAMRRFDWAGDGPYEAYPHCSQLSEFGLWSYDRDDLYFPGNRPNVRLAVASAPDGTGLALAPRGKGDVVFERYGDTVLVGHNGFVGGKGGKFMRPIGVRTFKKGEKITGSFDLMAVSAHRPAALTALFGEPNPLNPFMPFHQVYDQQ